MERGPFCGGHKANRGCLFGTCRDGEALIIPLQCSLVERHLQEVEVF